MDRARFCEALRGLRRTAGCRGSRCRAPRPGRRWTRRGVEHVTGVATSPRSTSRAWCRRCRSWSPATPSSPRAGSARRRSAPGPPRAACRGRARRPHRRMRATATMPAMTHAAQAEHHHAGAEPPPVEAEPFHDPMVRVRGPARQPRGAARWTGTLGTSRCRRIAWSASHSWGSARWGRRWPRTCAGPGSRSRSGTARPVAPATSWPSARREAATPGRRPPRAADVVVSCVSDTPDVEAVLFGPDGVAAGLAPGGLVIDCSTISPAATRRVRGPAARSGGSGSWTRRCRAARRGRSTPRSRSSSAARPATRSAREPGPRGDGQDHHPLRAGGQRPGGQGREPGRDRRRLPRASPRA